MGKRGANISLASYDDIFSTEESRKESVGKGEKVQEIAIADLYPFKDHPFKVLDNEDMQKTVESIEKFGVLTPAIVRPREEGGYEIVSGHRRHHACELAGLKTMPAIVRNLDDDAAVILMVDSNLSREEILPSERAFAYDETRVMFPIEEITQKLEQGLSDFMNSEKFKDYLNTMSKFHHYSVNNTILIAMQRPDATLVAGYEAWQKNFDRHVKRGSKGIKIISPVKVKKKS